MGNLSKEYAEIKNYRVCEDSYSVQTGQYLSVKKNGVDFIKADIPICITGLVTENGILTLSIKSNDMGHLEINVEESISKVCFEINNITQMVEVGANKNLILDIMKL